MTKIQWLVLMLFGYGGRFQAECWEQWHMQRMQRRKCRDSGCEEMEDCLFAHEFRKHFSGQSWDSLSSRLGISRSIRYKGYCCSLCCLNLGEDIATPKNSPRTDFFALLQAWPIVLEVVQSFRKFLCLQKRKTWQLCNFVEATSYLS